MRASAVPVTLALAAGLLAACGDDATATEKRWACPGDWVAYARGGCGPPVILCAPGGGAAAGACDGADISRPHVISDPAGDGTSFYRRPDGTIAGGWPDETFEPTAGIPTCPTGWTRTADGVCDPAVRTDCPAGSGALPGGTCTPTAESDCPATEFADVAAEAGTDPVYYVRVGADAATADGTMAHPYATVARAFLRASGRGWILLAAGTYTEALGLNGSVHVVGVCAAHVIIDAGDPTGVPAVRALMAGSTPELRGVTVRGPYYGVVSGNGASLTVRALRIDGASLFAASAQTGSTLRVEDSFITHTTANAAGQFGFGLQVQEASSLTATRVAVEDNRDQSANATEVGTELVIEDSTLRRTARRTAGTNGLGLRVDGGAHATLSRVLLEDHYNGATYIDGAGSSADLEDCVVRRTAGFDVTADLVGVVAYRGGAANVSRTFIDEGQPHAAVAIEAGSSLDITDSVMRRSRPSETEPDKGMAVLAYPGTRVHLTRTRIDQATGAALAAAGETTEMLLEDVRVGDTRPGPHGFGVGLLALSGAHIGASRVLVADSIDAAVAADTADGMPHDPPSRIELADSVLRDTRPNILSSTGGSGIVALIGSIIRVERTLVLRSHDHGVFSSEDALVTMRDSAVRDVAAPPSSPIGIGVGCLDGHACDLTRVLVENTVESGIDAWAGATPTLRDLLILSVAPSPRGFGTGVYSEDHASVELDRLYVGNAAGAGVAVVRGYTTEHATASVHGHDVLVRGIASSSMELIEDAAMPGQLLATGRPVAYGVHAGEGCSIELTQVVVDSAGYGFFSASGSLALRTGVITGQLDAAGAANGPGALYDLVDVAAYQNADDTIRIDGSLPAAASIPAPSPVCIRDGC